MNSNLISVVIPCYNEEGNVEAPYERVKSVFAGLPDYHYEHVFIDNFAKDKNVKVIFNTRNFGHIRSLNRVHPRTYFKKLLTDLHADADAFTPAEFAAYPVNAG